MRFKSFSLNKQRLMFHVGLPLQMTPPFKGLKLFNPKSKKVLKNDFVSISLKRDTSIQGTLFYVPKAFCKWKFAFDGLERMPAI